jgi:regulator of protease activity HflC (stomatin/prohibitin superfamily)
MTYFNEILKAISQFFQWWIIVMPWERGLRVRLGKTVKELKEGVYLKLPFIDTAFVQSVRIRVIPMPPQTISTRDRQTLTISLCVGYSISDIYQLFNSLNNPEQTLSNICMGHVATFVATCDMQELTPEKIQQTLTDKLKSTDYGLQFDYVKIISYAAVRTYRFIQDSHWIQDNLNLSNKV